MMLKAIIFDLDGVITDTAYLHFLAWRAVAAKIGITIDEGFNAGLKGISRMDSLKRILRRGGLENTFSQEERRRLAMEKNERYVQSLRGLNSHLIPL